MDHLVLAALLALPAGAQEVEPARSSTAPVSAEAPRATWIKQKTSLLYKNADGDIENEFPMTHSEDVGSSRLIVHDVSGDLSPNARFAYVFEKTDVWNTAKTKLLERRRLLRVFGSDGKLLWESANAEAPEGQAPLVFSADGEVALVLLHREKGWTASVRDYLGATLLEAGPFAKLESAALTPNGRYAMVGWLVPDQDAAHTFLDVKTKRRQDIASGDLYLGAAEIDGDGKVTSGKKVIFDFNAQDKEEKKP